MPSVAAMIVGFKAAEEFAEAKVADNRDYKDVADRWNAKADRYEGQSIALSFLANDDLKQQAAEIAGLPEAA